MAKIIKNEQIKALDVLLYDQDDNFLGEMSTADALKQAKAVQADLIVTSSMQSPPRCKLISKGLANQVVQQLNAKPTQAKTKEIRLTPHIEKHDLDTKLEQIKKLLLGGDYVLLVIKTQGKEAKKGETLAHEILSLLDTVAKPQTKLQISGKCIQVTLEKK